MEYAHLASLLSRLEETTKRLEITAILVEMLEQTAPDEMECVVRLMQGKVAPEWEGLEIGLAEKMILQVLARASGAGKAGIDDVTRVYHDAGDLGLAAQRLLASGASKQVGLMSFGAGPSQGLDVHAVFSALLQVARTTGTDSQARKQKLLEALLAKVGPLEGRYIIRTVAGRLRLGVAAMTFLDALTAWHLGQGVRSVQEMDEDERARHAQVRAVLEHAYDVRSDLAAVAATLAADGLDAVAALDVEHGTPLRPMAAERLKSLAEILEKHGGRSAMEYKYDGLRVQCHVTPDSVRIFSRRMEELTAQFPDVQETLRRRLRAASSCIVEGECVAVDAQGRMRPFQEISRRRGRKTGLGEDARKEAAFTAPDAEAAHPEAPRGHSAADPPGDAQGPGGQGSPGDTGGHGGEGQAGGPAGRAPATTVMDEVPVRVYLFDCLAVDGQSVMDEPYETRRARLPRLFDEDQGLAVSLMEVTEDEAVMESFFARAVADGAEGIMCKALDAPYKAGNRGFDWIKYKTDYTEELVDSMDLVVIGAFYGRGRRAGWYGALLMAAFDSDAGRYASVCKLGTGFDDETLKGLRERFHEHESPARPDDVDCDMQPDVWFHPAIVMEVQAAELTLSPTHRAAWGRLRDGAGLAARFPRFSGRWRDDKGPEDATTVEELVQMYGEQA